MKPFSYPLLKWSAEQDQKKGEKGLPEQSLFGGDQSIACG